MSNTITVTGNAGRDAELKFTSGGSAVLEFSIADTPRRKNDRGEWEDAGETAWYRISIWGPLAQALADARTISKGATVTVTGSLTVRSYEKDGQTRQSLDVRAETVGVREKRGQSGGFTSQAASAPKSDPWASPAGGSFTDEPPF